MRNSRVCKRSGVLSPTPEASDGSSGTSEQGCAGRLAFAEVRDIRAACIHVAGQRQLVERCLELARAHDIAQARILADPFDQASPGGKLELSAPTLPETGPRQFSPDPEMWEALDHGRLLTTILEAFYTRVYADERLSPYFQRITKDRIVGKVYSYLRQTFTGDKVYFGDHPRNAHHWMVIDDGLFAYRAALLEECMRQQGLDERFVRRWCALEELFRRDIVKDGPSVVSSTASSSPRATA
jgi:truncated hemoglobin YjbI